MSRIVRFHKIGGPEVLQIDELETPLPAAGEVRIAVRALGLNRAEAMFRSGNYVEQPAFPSRLGYESAGVIHDVGEGVIDFAPGDVVSVVPSRGLGKYGAYGEIATVPARNVVKHPASLSFVEAAAAWMQYVTAYGALVDIAALNSNDHVVITAASSSVGLAAIQIANAVGATPIALTRAGVKRAALLRAGAGHVVVTAEDDPIARIAEITQGAGPRVVFDPVGGPFVETLVEVLSAGGTLFLYGALSPAPTPFPLFPALVKGLTLRGYSYSEIVNDAQRFERAKRFIVAGLSSGALKPIIAKTFTLDEIVEAHRYLESNEQVGKIVVTV